jgi:hypothetical protein
MPLLPIILPPHGPDEAALVAKMVFDLQNGDQLPPIVVVSDTQPLQAITGSHRLAAWEKYFLLTGMDQRHVIFVSKTELAEHVLDNNETFEQAWQRCGQRFNFRDFVHQLHSATKRKDLREALEGQW